MSNNERIIKPVSDNIDKQRTYTTMLTRYNLHTDLHQPTGSAVP